MHIFVSVRINDCHTDEKTCWAHLVHFKANNGFEGFPHGRNREMKKIFRLDFVGTELLAVRES